jgi:hypothetical protein
VIAFQRYLLATLATVAVTAALLLVGLPDFLVGFAAGVTMVTIFPLTGPRPGDEAKA